MTGQRRALIVIGCTLVLSMLALYFGFFGLARDRMESLYRSGAWYFLLLSLLLWLQKLSGYLPGLEELGAAGKRHWPAAATALLLVLLALFASPPDYRILADETNLLGMAQALYEERSCHNPTQVLNFYHGIRRTISSSVDKRPALYPFLTAAVHALTGYRPENAFVVNAVAGFGVLFLLYLAVQGWYGRFWGIVSMLLLASFPLFVLYMTSAGFEVLNLLFAMILFYAAWKFIERPQAGGAEVMFLTLPLLAQTRYESALAVFCVVALVLACLPKVEYARLTWRTLLTPLLFLPVAWLRVFTHSQQALQVESMEQAFGLSHLWANMCHALPFFAGSEKAYAMIPLLAVTATAGLAWMLFDLFWAQRRERSSLVFAAFAGFFFLLHAVARFVYYWGNLRLQYISRLGVIFLPIIVFFSIYLLRKLVQTLGFSRNWAPLLAVLLMVYGWPVAGQNLAVRDIFYFREFKTVREFLQQHYPHLKGYILVSDLSNLYVPFGYSAVSPEWVSNNMDEVARSLDRGTWQRLLVVQKMNIASRQPVAGSEMPPRFALKPLYHSQLSPEKLIRISVYEPPYNAIQKSDHPQITPIPPIFAED